MVALLHWMYSRNALPLLATGVVDVLNQLSLRGESYERVQAISSFFRS